MDENITKTRICLRRNLTSPPFNSLPHYVTGLNRILRILQRYKVTKQMDQGYFHQLGGIFSEQACPGHSQQLSCFKHIRNSPKNYPKRGDKLHSESMKSLWALPCLMRSSYVSARYSQTRMTSARMFSTVKTSTRHCDPRFISL